MHVHVEMYSSSCVAWQIYISGLSCRLRPPPTARERLSPPPTARERLSR